MAEREKGTATVSCPNCGASLGAVDQPDGAVAYERCSKCYPKRPVAEKAASSSTRETGTNVKKEKKSSD